MSDAKKHTLGWSTIPRFVGGVMDGFGQTGASIADLLNIADTVRSLKELFSLPLEQIWEILYEAIGEDLDEYRDDFFSKNAYRIGQAVAKTVSLLLAGAGAVKTATKIKSSIQSLIAQKGKFSWMKDSPNFKNGVYEQDYYFPIQNFGEVKNIVYTSGKFSQITAQGKRKLTGNKLDYVLLQNGELKFGEAHTFIANGNQIRYAGQIHLGEGKKTVSSWDNGSGHIRPSIEDKEGVNLVKEAFHTKFGLELPEISEFFKSTK